MQYELRIRLNLADVYDALGDLEKAKAIAEEVLPIAEQIGYSDIAGNAKLILEGQTIFGMIRNIVKMSRKDGF